MSSMYTPEGRIIRALDVRLSACVPPGITLDNEETRWGFVSGTQYYSVCDRRREVCLLEPE